MTLASDTPAKLTLVLSHNDFYILAKPAGMNFHSEQEPGFVVRAELQFNEKLFAVHRLDKVTSGLIILARNRHAAAKFTELFSQRQISKYYLALSDSKPKKKQGWIKGDMAKSRRGAFKLLSTKTNPAITRFYSYSYKAGFRAYLLKPYSGKTHQLRVAMKSISAPIFGDTLYSGTAAERTYLHAYALHFCWHNDEQIAVTLLPEQGSEFISLISEQHFQAWQTPWQLDW